MGNRAVITTPERKIGLYVQWNAENARLELPMYRAFSIIATIRLG